MLAKHSPWETPHIYQECWYHKKCQVLAPRPWEIFERNILIYCFQVKHSSFFPFLNFISFGTIFCDQKQPCFFFAFLPEGNMGKICFFLQLALEVFSNNWKLEILATIIPLLKIAPIINWLFTKQPNSKFNRLGCLKGDSRTSKESTYLATWPLAPCTWHLQELPPAFCTCRSWLFEYLPQDQGEHVAEL